MRQEIFKPGQIVCLETESSTLYAEVIQVVPLRQLCWARPLTLVSRVAIANYNFDTDANLEMIDLRSSSDLLLPIALFRASYDTEAIGVLSELASRELEPERNRKFFNLNDFVRELCKNNQDKF